MISHFLNKLKENTQYVYMHILVGIHASEKIELLAKACHTPVW